MLDGSVVDVSTWEVDADEPAGQDEKQWLIDPDTGFKWLFKPPTERHGFRQREDWSEKVCADLANLISVPCADVRLVSRNGRVGSLSKNLRPPNWEMQSGAQLLSEIVESYQPGYMNVKGRPGHSLENIALALENAGPPPDANLPPELNAFDVFAGYLVLDAWIANRDRHDENWSILLPPPDDQEPRRLCGSYDQAGGLGYNVREDVGKEILAGGRGGGVRWWVERGTAYRFEHEPSAAAPTLVAHACTALNMASASARAYWLARLAQLTAEQVEAVVRATPRVSEVCRTFACEVLRINRERVLYACN